MSHKISIHSFGCTKAPCTQSVTEMPHSVMSPPARVRRMVVDGPTADIVPTDGGYILDISKPTPGKTAASEHVRSCVAADLARVRKRPMVSVLRSALDRLSVNFFQPSLR